MVVETSRRRFSYQGKEYHLNKKKSKQHIKRIITYGIKHNRNPEAVLDSLKAKGIGYRRTNFMEDYARGQSTEYSRTHQSYDRAKNFFDTVKNLKKKEKIKYYPSAVKKVKEYEKRDYAGTLTKDDIKYLERLSPIGEYIFGTSPVW